MRLLYVFLTASLLILCVTPAAGQTTTFPFSDDVEDATATAAAWTPSDGTALARYETGKASSGTHVWRFEPGSNTSLVLAAPMTITTAQNPFVQFRAFYDRASSSGTLYLDVSTDAGANWDQVDHTRVGIVDTWRTYQFSLEAYREPGVLIRIRQSSASYPIFVDDIIIDEAPKPGLTLLTNATNNGMTVSWTESTAPDFDSYVVVFDNTNPTSTEGWFRYGGTSSDLAIYMGSGCYDSSGNLEYVASSVCDARERRQVVIADRQQTSLEVSDLTFTNRTYHVRVFERDAQGFLNFGNETVSDATTFQADVEVAPFTQDFEGTFNYASDLPWTVTSSEAGESGHSTSKALEDSPNGTYGGKQLRNFYVKVDFTGVDNPVLTFNHRYNFNVDGGDEAEIWYRPDEGNWVQLAEYDGFQPLWSREEFDLRVFGRFAEVRSGVLRFRNNTDYRDNRDGWHIDDIAVVENPEAETGFPFLDDVENTQVSEQRWIGGQWKFKETGSAHSGTHVWYMKDPIQGTNQASPALTLAGPMDLRSADNPFVSFWARTNQGYETVYVDASTDGGSNWTEVDYTRDSVDSGWKRYQFSLLNFVAPSVLVRLRSSSPSREIQVDDIIIDEAPKPGLTLLTNATNNGMTVSWTESTAPDFDSYVVVFDNTNPTSTEGWFRYGGTSSDLAIYMGSGCYDSSGNLEYVASSVCDARERRQVVIADRQQTSLEVSDLTFTNRTYHVRVFERDAQGFLNFGNETVSDATTFQADVEVAPFTQDFEGTFNYASDLPWTVTSSEAGESGHSTSKALEDSPNGTYGGKQLRNFYVKVDFTGVDNPVLTFNHRYNFNVDGGDEAEIWYRPDEGNWVQLAEYDGFQPLWSREEFDLRVFGRFAEVRSGVLRFRNNTDYRDNRDGWHIDDIAVVENPEAETGFPFLDDVENTQVSEQRWIGGQWKFKETGSAHSGTHVWYMKDPIQGTNQASPALTLAGPMDLRSADNPFVSFWARTNQSSETVYVDASTDGGSNWTEISSRSFGTTWTEFSADLAPFVSPASLVRLRSGSPSREIQIDDITISGDFPAKSIAPSVSAIDFGVIQAGTPLVAEITLFNPGTEAVSGLITGTGTGFALTAGSGGFSVEPGASHLVGVTLSPTVEGSYSGAITVAHDATNISNPLSIPMFGRTTGTDVCATVAVNARWNMLSIPAEPSNRSYRVLFPGAISDAFNYTSSAYQASAIMTAGKGYWLRFDEVGSYEVCGAPLIDESVAVHAGWNMIGGFGSVISTASIASQPAGILQSQFFGFDNGYQAATQLIPGDGYWIELSQAGTLDLSGTASKAQQPALATVESQWPSLYFTQESGARQRLRLAPNAPPEGFALPPVPPADVFDVRFSSGEFVAFGGAWARLQIQHAGEITLLSTDGLGNHQVLELRSSLDGTPLGLLSNGERLAVANSTALIDVRIAELPSEFALSQNYPNPFNPTTSISFDLPEAVGVRLQVFDILGRQIATLASGRQEAGSHTVSWDARRSDGSTVSNGVYFYVLEAGAFRATRRMVLMK